MANQLNSGFSNNINVIQIRTSGSSSQRVTDRAIDTDSDGTDDFAIHDVLKTTVDSDGGIKKSESEEYTTGGN